MSVRRPCEPRAAGDYPSGRVNRDRAATVLKVWEHETSVRGLEQRSASG